MPFTSSFGYITLVSVGVIYASVVIHPVMATSEDTNSRRGLNILILSEPYFGHLAPLLAVGEELAWRGHNVTLCSVISEDEHDKFRAHVEHHGIHLWIITPPKGQKVIDSALLKSVSESFIWTTMNDFCDVLISIMTSIMEHVKESLSRGEWDIVLGNIFSAAIAPCIHSSYQTPTVFIGIKISGMPHLYPPWPFPGLLQGASSDNLGILDRALSLLYNSINNFLAEILVYFVRNAVNNYCPSLNFTLVSYPGFHAPVIIPSVVGFDYSQPIWPLTSYVGALISRSPAILSGELKEWLGSKPDRSVIYISMGSLFNLDKDSGMAIIEGVMTTNYSILWSLRKSNQWILEGVELDADRVLISEWTPQFSVLGSRAIHSAILHGGSNGLNEALWNGVPVIAFPQMAEQIFNAGRLHFNRLGIYVDKVILSSSVIAKSIEELDTGEYRENVAKIQKMFRLAGGAKRAADLVEFYEEVGYDHLVPSFVKYQWSWVQYYNADVYALLMVILLVMAVSFIACCRCVCNRYIHHSGDKIRIDTRKN